MPCHFVHGACGFGTPVASSDWVVMYEISVFYKCYYLERVRVVSSYLSSSSNISL